MFRALAATYREAFAGLPRPVWLISAATLVNRSGTMVLPFLILFLTQERGFTPTQAGQILAMYGIGGVLGSYLGGWLCDVISPRRVMEGSLLLTGIGFFFLGQLEARWAILLMMVVLSMVAEAFRPACSAALAAETGPDERVRALALNRLAINMGMSLGPAVGGFLAARDYSWLFRVDGLTCIAASAFLWLALRGVAESRPAPLVAGEPADRSPWRDAPFLAAMGLLFLLACVTFQMASTYTLTLRDFYGFNEAKIGLVMAINTLVIVLFEMVLIHRLGKTDPLRVMAVGSFLFCLGFGLLPFGQTMAYVAFTVLIWTIGEMLTLPVMAGVVANRAGERSRGRYMALFTIAFEGAFVIAPLAGTWIYQSYGTYVLWVGCIGIGFLLLAGYWALSGVLGRPAPAVLQPATHP
jgi:predicted MFS family arabinose efflux permease